MSLLPPRHALIQQGPAWLIESSTNQVYLSPWPLPSRNWYLICYWTQPPGKQQHFLKVAREPSGVSSSSSSSFELLPLSSWQVLLLWGGIRPARSAPLYCMPKPDSCGSTPLCVAPCSSIANLSFRDLTLLERLSRFFQFFVSQHIALLTTIVTAK